MMKCEFEGKTYTVIQNAYISSNGKTYQAHAIDEEENDFLVYWLITKPNVEDENEACNWYEIHDVKRV